MNENYYLVTVTVTYRVDDAKTPQEATGIIEHVLVPSRELDGVTLEATRDGFWTEISETENGISTVEIGEFGQQTEAKES